MQPLCMLQYLIGLHVSGKNSHPQVHIIQHVLSKDCNACQTLKIKNYYKNYKKVGMVKS
jgi:hypothetical protein